MSIADPISSIFMSVTNKCERHGQTKEEMESSLWDLLFLLPRLYIGETGENLKTDWTQADDKERWFQLSDSIDLWTPLFTGTMHNALPTALTTFNDWFWKADSLT